MLVKHTLNFDVVAGAFMTLWKGAKIIFMMVKLMHTWICIVKWSETFNNPLHKYTPHNFLDEIE